MSPGSELPPAAPPATVPLLRLPCLHREGTEPLQREARCSSTAGQMPGSEMLCLPCTGTFCCGASLSSERWGVSAGVAVGIRLYGMSWDFNWCSWLYFVRNLMFLMRQACKLLLNAL